MKTCGCDSEQSSLKLVYLQLLGLCEQNSCPRYETLYVLAAVGSPVYLHVNVPFFRSHLGAGVATILLPYCYFHFRLFCYVISRDIFSRA